MQQWSSAQRDVSLTQLPGLKHLSPGAEVSKLCRDYAATPPGPARRSISIITACNSFPLTIWVIVEFAQIILK